LPKASQPTRGETGPGEQSPGLAPGHLSGRLASESVQGWKSQATGKSPYRDQVPAGLSCATSSSWAISTVPNLFVTFVWKMAPPTSPSLFVLGNPGI
jgi:transglutaminase-like putative cysteine protease